MMEDIEMMEGLGIYEVSTEDFALWNSFAPPRWMFKI